MLSSRPSRWFRHSPDDVLILPVQCRAGAQIPEAAPRVNPQRSQPKSDGTMDPLGSGGALKGRLSAGPEAEAREVRRNQGEAVSCRQNPRDMTKETDLKRRRGSEKFH